MNKYKIATALTAVYMVSLTSVFAAQVKVINHTDKNIHIFFRAKGNPKPPLKDIVQAQDTKYFTISEEQLDNEPIFEVTAATSKTNPDWNLFAGTCDRLSKENDYSLVIESNAIGKVSCKTIPE